jgi:tubulin polyglutamylase TTLL6/13
VNIERLVDKIKDLIIKTICTVQPSISHLYNTCQPEDMEGSMCFEILG